jgi:hypothetical protein
VSVVCCQVEVSATSWLLVQRSPTECSPSYVIYKPQEWGHDPRWVTAPQEGIRSILPGKCKLYLLLLGGNKCTGICIWNSEFYKTCLRCSNNDSHIIIACTHYIPALSALYESFVLLSNIHLQFILNRTGSVVILCNIGFTCLPHGEESFLRS